MAESATPNIPNNLIATNAVSPNNTIGIIVLKYPSANPYMTLMAGPVSHDYAIS